MTTRDFAAGYEAAEADLSEWLCETVRDWHAAGIYTHQELLAAQALVHEVTLRTSRGAER
jgi:hypothetical protein